MLCYLARPSHRFTQVDSELSWWRLKSSLHLHVAHVLCAALVTTAAADVHIDPHCLHNPHSGSCQPVRVWSSTCISMLSRIGNWQLSSAATACQLSHVPACSSGAPFSAVQQPEATASSAAASINRCSPARQSLVFVCQAMSVTGYACGSSKDITCMREV